MTRPLAVYGAALRRAVAGHTAVLDVVNAHGEPVSRLDASQWMVDLRAGDQSLLDMCHGATLDVGCGPGRLVASLTRAGQTALGVDVSPEAVRQTIRRGAWAVCGSVFGPLPMDGRWGTILLADGNIGIGGDPRALLRRCRALLDRRGAILAELSSPGEPSWSGAVALRHGDRVSAPFPWARVAAPDVTIVARQAGLTVDHQWTEAGRWFVRLTPA